MSHRTWSHDRELPVIRAQESLTHDEELDRLTRKAVEWLERACVCLAGVADLADDDALKQRVRSQVHALKVFKRQTERLS